MHLNRPLCFYAAASGLILIAAVCRIQAADTPRLQIKQTEEAVFPRALLAQGVNEGDVWITLSLDADGKLTDAIPSRFTARLLADEAMRLLRKWTFEPVRVKGRAVPVCTEIHLSFHATGAIVVLDPVIDMNRRSTLPSRPHYESAICDADELDVLPTPVRQVPPLLPGSTTAAGGKVVIEFIIDEQGHPRMPVLVSAPDPDLGNRAGDALMQWEFSPPTRNGKPVAVRVQQQFVFRGASSTLE